MNDLTPREKELLRLVVQWYRKHGTDTEVERGWLREKMGIEEPRLSTLRSGLARKGYLGIERNSFALTETSSLQLTVPTKRNDVDSPIYLPLFGQVRAGRTRSDDLRVDYSDSMSKENNSISIPHLTDYSGVYVLEVVGTSMEKEGIYAGDYAIVKPLPPNHAPKQRDLVVAKYLPIENEPYVQDINNVDEDLLEGPTIKYLTYHAGAEREYRLGWRKSTHISEETITSKRVITIGQVVGIYRPINGNKKNT